MLRYDIELNQSMKNKRMQNKNIRFDKKQAAKAEKNRKNHIEHILRNDPKKIRVVKFAREIAAKKIQQHFRAYIDYKKEREKILFEQAIKR